MRYRDEVEEEQEEQEQEEIQQTKSCPHCGSRSDSIYQKEASIPTYILSIAAIFFFQFWSVCIIPIIIQSTQMIAKRCYDCDQIIQKHNLFSIPSLSDQVLNFRFGSCAVILSRKYAYIILTVLIILFTYRQYTHVTVQEIGSDQVIKNNEISQSWKDYINYCGREVYLSNEVRAKSNFNHIFNENIVNWEGIFMLYLKPPVISSSNYVYLIRLKMEPSDSAPGNPDLALKINNTVHQNYQNILNDLIEGEVLKFKAKFFAMGDEFSDHILELIHIEKTGQKKKIEEIQYVDQLDANKTEDENDDNKEQNKDEKENEDN